jgi:small subunit ribosomal protein S3
MANRDVKGARIAVAGRLGGAEMARREQIKRGGIPLQTFELISTLLARRHT